MKNLIALTLVLFASYSNATSILPKVAEVKQVSQKIESVALFANGLLVAYPREGKAQQMRLAPSVNLDLMRLAQMVGEAEIITTHQHVVCMMMPNPFTARELYARTDKGLDLVLSAGGCAHADHTQPKEAYQLQMAQDLRNQLVLLGQQLLND